MAYYLEATGGAATERAEIRFAEDGFVDVFVGTQSTGQGHETAYVQLTVDQLGIDGDKVRVSRATPTPSRPAAAPAARAASTPRARPSSPPPPPSSSSGKQAASEALEAAPADIVFEAGRFSIVGTDRGMDIMELAATQRARANAART